MKTEIVASFSGVRLVRTSATEAIFEELQVNSLFELSWVRLASIYKRPDFTWSCYDLDPSLANKLIGILVKQLIEK